MRSVFVVLVSFVAIMSLVSEGSTRSATPIPIPPKVALELQTSSTRAVGDTCTAGVELAAYYYSGWEFWSGEAYGVFNDSTNICLCCTTTTVLPLRVCYYFGVRGDTTGANIEYLVHGELWSATAGTGTPPDTCLAVPDVIICDGPQLRLSLPNPGDGSFVFYWVCIPLSNCTDLDCLPDPLNYFSVVRFDSTGNNIVALSDDSIDECMDWSDWSGSWAEMGLGGGDLTIWADYECTGDPIPVEMSSLNAVGSPGAVDICWRTETEEENLGFNIYRGLDDYQKTQINSSLIPGHGTTRVPSEYSYTDTDVSSGTRYFYWVSDIDYSGNEVFHGPVSVLVPQETPSELALSSAGWNGSEMNLALSLPSEGETKLVVYDIAGREVATLIDQVLPAGQAIATWDGSSSSGDAAASGMYVIRLVHESGVANVKTVISR